MESELANRQSNVPERFIPELMRGEVMEAEHLGRYHWAQGFVARGRVLDAGCGAGYGSALLADAGASAVLGIDIAASVLDAARPQMPDGVELEQGDLRSLDQADDSFDLIVCFEVIEHVEDPQEIIDELARVLAPGGVLLVSSPNREIYPEGNPHHHHEFTPEELRAALAPRFENVALLRQHNWLTSAILGDESFAADDDRALGGLVARKIIGKEPGLETYTIAAAANGPLPSAGEVAVLTHAAEPSRWLGLWDEQLAAIEARDRRIVELEDVDERRRALQKQLVEAETENARIPGLESQIAELEAVNRQLASSVRPRVKGLARLLMRRTVARLRRIAGTPH